MLFDGDTGAQLVGSTEVALPSFAVNLNSFEGAGLGGFLGVPSSTMQAIEATFNFSFANRSLARMLATGETRRIDLRADVIEIDAETRAKIHVPERIVLQGPMSEGNPGSRSPNNPAGAIIIMQVWFCQHWYDGDEFRLFDPANRVHKVDGVDLWASMRRNMGV
jgi:P2 family phage contractile tail tube protein